MSVLFFADIAEGGEDEEDEDEEDEDEEDEDEEDEDEEDEDEDDELWCFLTGELPVFSSTEFRVLLFDDLPVIATPFAA